MHQGCRHNAEVEELVAGEPQVKGARVPPLRHAQRVYCRPRLHSRYQLELVRLLFMLES